MTTERRLRASADPAWEGAFLCGCRSGDAGWFAWAYLPGARAWGRVGLVELPSGTVTFLFTDIEGSTTCLWEEHP